MNRGIQSIDVWKCNLLMYGMDYTNDDLCSNELIVCTDDALMMYRDEVNAPKNN